MDFIVNGVLTIAFVIPIYKSNSRSLQWLAKKSVFAALAGFVRSFPLSLPPDMITRSPPQPTSSS